MVRIHSMTDNRPSAMTLSPSGVPAIGTSKLTGMDCGGMGIWVSSYTQSIRSSRLSPIPTIDPEQTLIPASRTWLMVANRSS